MTPPIDCRGLLEGTSEGPDSVDVIICVRDALEDVHRCLASVLECSGRPFRLIVVDDGSARPTAEYLERFKQANPTVDLRRCEGRKHGYTIAANVGLRASTGKYVVLLNSDTIVTRGWLERLLAAQRSGDDIGIVGPLSNAASHQSVPELRDGEGWSVNELPDWLTPDGMASVVARLPGPETIRIPFLNGFCYCIDRRVIDVIGVFDEKRFADGYSEENDYSLRAADAGFALAVATRAYVFHAKSRSYGSYGRFGLAERNYRRFLSKHGKARVRSLVAHLEKNGALAALRAQIAEAIDTPRTATAHLPVRRVTFVLPAIAAAGSGGSHSIYQEVGAMRSLGLPARIAVQEKSRQRAQTVYPDGEGMFVMYSDDEDLAQLLDGDDVAVATHFKSVPSVAAVVADGRVGLGAYYVQDYEPLFVPEGSPDAVEASESYQMIEDAVLFAKTDWIRQTLAERESVPVAKVEPSLDRSIFHCNRERRADQRPHIIAMLRPRTPRRAARETLDVLAEVADHYGSRVRITTFGCRQEELAALGSVPAGIEHRGLLSRHEVAELMRDADVFLDCSWYQAFGRTSLEAMACGATTVVPAVGGAYEFAEDGVNSLVVDTSSRAEAFAALARLLDNPQLLRELKTAAVGTAGRYSTTKAAVSEHALLSHELDRRRGLRSLRATGVRSVETGALG